jgi:hypothetical protein
MSALATQIARIFESHGYQVNVIGSDRSESEYIHIWGKDWRTSESEAFSVRLSMHSSMTERSRCASMEFIGAVQKWGEGKMAYVVSINYLDVEEFFSSFAEAVDYAAEVIAYEILKKYTSNTMIG